MCYGLFFLIFFFFNELCLSFEKYDMTSFPNKASLENDKNLNIYEVKR